MSRRSTATVVGGVALVVLLAVASFVSVPYVIYSPGPTVNLLGTSAKREIVQVDGGAKAYRDKGALRLLTVSPTGPDSRVSLIDALVAWVRPSQAVYRYSDIYQPSDTADGVEEEGQVDMVSSQDSAVATALHELGYTFDSFVQVLGVTRGGPGDGALEARDHLVTINGTTVTTLQSAVDAIKAVKPGTKVPIVIVRAGKAETIKVKTAPSDADATKSALKVTIGTGYDFPVDVRVRIDDNIGGPSAGMMFTLAIYDTLTPGSITGGANIAGTGTMDPQGHVGGIGGIQQKLVAAQAAGAKLFIAPSSNCDEVRHGPYDAHKMRVVKVSTFHAAVTAVEAWRKNHDAKLPTC